MMTFGRTDEFRGQVAKKAAAMLREPSAPVWSDVDREVFQHLVPPDHPVRRALESIDFERFRPLLAPCYSEDLGRPAEDPVRMLKLEFLQYLHLLSDRQVIERATTDAACRNFLGLSLRDRLSDPSSLSAFRGRLGVEGHQKIFSEVVAQAREHGLVKDRLRLKDATHVIAEVAVPTTRALLAQIRDKLLAAVESCDPVRVAGERARLDVLRPSTEGCNVEQRLVARVAHLREILAWVDELAQPNDPDQNRSWQQFLAVRQLAHKLLTDQDNPQAGDRTRSVVDPDARRGKHGSWYDNYLLDIAIDLDSELITALNVLPANGDEAGDAAELITALNVLPANGDEAGDAAELIRREETAHGNDIQSLSMDGVGFQGPVLRELESAEGPALEVYVPPTTETPSEYFKPRSSSKIPPKYP
jgi:transposase